ncbi:MAG: thiamine-phosphate kinase [Phycicoccus sp.]|nr:thiamine-phosphate kinase [Phycicoccus sp.]
MTTRPVLGDFSEAEILARILPHFTSDDPRVIVPAGDDAAVVNTGVATVVTTDSMVRGLDWRDDWSTGADVGRKVVVQNVADVAAMGAVCRGLVVALVAGRDTPMDFVMDLTAGIAQAAAGYAVPVLGGDLSGAPAGVVIVTITALGDLEGQRAVLRSGARPGDTVAVCGTLGRSGGGLAVLQRTVTVVGHESPAWSAEEQILVHAHRTAGHPPLAAGPAAARAGATAMIDVSDGLVRDAGRVALASGVELALDRAALEGFADGPLRMALGGPVALREVLAGGEEHALLATFPADVPLPVDPAPWVAIGTVVVPERGPRVTVGGHVPEVLGWDHFAG